MSRLLSIEQIAEVCHELNRVYCVQLGDHSQVPWAAAPSWQRDSALAGVRAIAAGRVTSPGASHAGWLAQKEADGWVYGPEKDAVLKQHPCVVPFEELPPEQRIKDALFFYTAVALFDGRRIAEMVP